MEAQSLSTCNQCGKKFQRKAHLLRHQQQHSGDRPYSCKFCSKTFKRSDVLRDHFNRCDRRGTSEIPGSLERGRKRHACDECSRLKVKCDSEVPCAKCREFGRTCLKSRPAVMSTGASSPDETYSNNTTPELIGSDRNSIGFLLNCPGGADFITQFPKDIILSPNSGPADFSNIGSLPMNNGFEPYVGDMSGQAQAYGGYGHMPQDMNLDVFLGQLEFDNFNQQTQDWPMEGENLMLWSGQNAIFLDRNVLERRAFDIRTKLMFAAIALNAPLHPSQEIIDATEIFTADNIEAYIKLYFKHWHKHAPMVHEATFNPCTAALPLVLALMSLGGMYGSDSVEVTKLKLLLDSIENCIYAPGLADEYDLPGRPFVRKEEKSSIEWRQYQLQELQGAYLVIVLQSWTGNEIARTRVRQQRFSRIVGLIHLLDLATVQHPSNFTIIDNDSFRDWIVTESCIRFVTIAVMLDNAFGIFNNVPPRFQWPELDLTFPSNHRIFATANYAEMLAHALFPVPKIKIKDAFLVLFSPLELADEGLASLRRSNLTPLDMQMLIHFVYTHVWKSTFSNPLALLPFTDIHVLVQPSKTVLRNWKVLWDEIKAVLTEDDWSKFGFQRTAESYYDAVHAMLGLFEKRQGKFPPIPSDCEKGSHMKRLLSFNI